MAEQSEETPITSKIEQGNQSTLIIESQRTRITLRVKSSKQTSN